MRNFSHETHQTHSSHQKETHRTPARLLQLRRHADRVKATRAPQEKELKSELATGTRRVGNFAHSLCDRHRNCRYLQRTGRVTTGERALFLSGANELSERRLSGNGRIACREFGCSIAGGTHLAPVVVDCIRCRRGTGGISPNRTQPCATISGGGRADIDRAGGLVCGDRAVELAGVAVVVGERIIFYRPCVLRQNAHHGSQSTEWEPTSSWRTNAGIPRRAGRCGR